MPAVRCPVPGCDYITDDVDSAIVVALINAHSASHTGGEAVKVEHVGRPTTTAAGSGEDVKSPIATARERSENISGRNANRTTYLKLCHKYNGSGCERYDSCPYIHMCRTYVESKCGKECSKNHNIFDPRVKEILERNGADINRKPKKILADIKVALKDDRSKSNRDKSKNSKAESVDEKMLKQSGLKICFKYNGRGCERGGSCSYIHICMSYVKGMCGFGKCSRSHDICDPTVISAFNKHGINTKKPKREILADFQAAIKYNESMSSHEEGGNSEAKSSNEKSSKLTTPKICYKYSGKGCEADFCPYIHMCRNYVECSCKFGKACNKSHDICNPAVKAILAKHGINTNRRPREMFADLQAAVRNDDSKSFRVGGEDRKATRTASRKIICLFNLRGRCRWNFCPNVHSELPYQWRWKSLSEKDWNILSEHENVLMECTYSDPSNREYTLASETGVNITIDFQTMTGTGTDRQTYTSYIIRRISTPSAVEYTRDRWATVWQWYWQNEDGKWIKYEYMTGPSNIRKISNNDIEQAYINNPEGQIACGGNSNFIDFSRMTQIDVDNKTVVKVCRRPTFVSEREAREKKRQLDLKPEQKVPVSSTVDMFAPPPNWKMSPGEDISDHCQLTTLQDTDIEYKEIESYFYECPPISARIKSIKRIENYDLWENYVSKRTKMLKKKSKEEVGERRVFHGTKNQYVDPIWHQGFDFRLSGQTSGTVYGKGCYFATSSKYADYYAEVGPDVTMFVVKILPGAYVRGRNEYKRPPHKDEGNPSSELYDSCVDDESNPQKFILFDNNQIYPEYLITYSYGSTLMYK